MTSGWAISLNGVVLTSGCETHEFDCVDPVLVVDGLTAPPDGMALPGQRTEDVVYAQRDGVRMFSDWYVNRILTFVGTIGPGEECADCTDTRAQVLEAAQAWKRGCCNTELVIYPPCPVPHGEANAYPPNVDDATVVRTNLATGPRATRFITGIAELGPSDDFGFGTYTLETSDGPSGEDLETFVRKTSTIANIAGAAILHTLVSPATSPITPGEGFPVTAGLDYNLSYWMRSSVAAADFVTTYRWYDVTGTALAALTDVVSATAVAANTWLRGDNTITAPAGAVAVALSLRTSAAVNGMTTDVTGVLFEQVTVVGSYFDGSFDDVYNLDETWTTFAWSGTANESASTLSSVAATYSGTIESGPYGVVGRPRVFDYDWLPRSEHIADFVARFDSVDQRMYILDECGTPGTNSCVEISPGSQLFSRCYDRCYTGAGRCYSTPVETSQSVDPTTIGVGGTEKVYPTITLFPNLNGSEANPIIVENTVTGDWIGYAGPVLGTTVITINTEEGTAFDGDGNSMTHLLRGSIFMSLDPGNHSVRLLSVGDTDEDTGYALTCWRPTVVVA